MDAERVGQAFGMLWQAMEDLDIPGMPGVPIGTPSFAELIPDHVAGIYFLVSRSAGLVYIGKARNIRSRWWPRRSPLDTSRIDWDHTHEKLRDALDLGDVTLRWWELPRAYLAAAESVLIEIRRPAWNCARG